METKYQEDFCKEIHCPLYKTMMILSLYEPSKLIKDQRETAKTECNQNCPHPQQKVDEWLKARAF
jgi:hypothetical protein